MLAVYSIFKTFNGELIPDAPSDILTFLQEVRVAAVSATVGCTAVARNLHACLCHGNREMCRSRSRGLHAVQYWHARSHTNTPPPPHTSLLPLSRKVSYYYQ